MTTPQETIFTPMLLQQLRRLELKVKRAIDADMLGRYRSAFRGSGLVVADLREYQPGDEVKHIDWKATARAARVLVKSFEEEREARIQIVLDVSRSMSVTNAARETQGSRTQFSRATEFSALIAMLSSLAGDAVGLALFSSKVERFIPPKRGTFHTRMLLGAILDAEATITKTDLNSALAAVKVNARRRSIIVIVSDLITPDFSENLRALALRHEVIVAHVADDVKAITPAAGLVQFKDAESGEEIVLDTSLPAVQYFLASKQRALREQLAEQCTSCGAHYIAIDTTPFAALLALTTKKLQARR